MTKEDYNLLEQARNVRGYDYAFLDSLIAQAQSEECRLRIEDIRHRLYRREEASADML